jgi:hypothetical protein
MSFKRRSRSHQKCCQEGRTLPTHATVKMQSRLVGVISTLTVHAVILFTVCGCNESSNASRQAVPTAVNTKHLTKAESLDLGLKAIASGPGTPEEAKILAIFSQHADVDLLDCLVNNLPSRVHTAQGFSTTLRIWVTLSSQIAANAGKSEVSLPKGALGGALEDYVSPQRRQEITAIWRTYVQHLKSAGVSDNRGAFDR